MNESTVGADAEALNLSYILVSSYYLYIGAKSGTMIVAKEDTKSSKSAAETAALQLFLTFAAINHLHSIVQS